jgi:hypothetical protein
MAASVEDVVGKCLYCHQSRPGQPGIQTELVPINLERRNQLVSIDLVGAGIVSESGNQYILVMVDGCTKYLEVVAIPNKTSKVVAEAFVSGWILRHGPPEAVLSDRGAEFTARFFQALTGFLGVNQIKTTAHHPQGNGLVERAHRTLLSTLGALCEGNHRKWDQYLPHAAYYYNTAVHSSSGFTPYFLTYGRQAADLLAWNWAQDDLEVEESLQEESVATFVSRMNRARKLVLKNLEQARDAYRRKYGRRVNRTVYKVHDLVWIWTPEYSPNTSPKFASAWRGPYQIERCIHNYDVVVRRLSDGWTTRVHVNRLRKMPSFLLTMGHQEDQNLQGELADGIASSYYYINRPINWKLTQDFRNDYPTLHFQVQFYGTNKRTWLPEYELPEWICQDFVGLFDHMSVKPQEE